MSRIKETLEYFNASNGQVVKKKSHYIDMEDGYFGTTEEYFEKCVQAFLARRKKARTIMDSVERETISEKKSVITILPCLTVEYAQRWTYELYA